MQEAYIVAGFRTAVTKSKKGGFRFFRPDDLAVEVIKGLVATLPGLDPKEVDDVIVGNAVPEAEQGLQFGRIIAARALGEEVAGITINRYCASGLESIAMATAKIRSGMADCIIAGGTESMSMVPTAGWKTVPSYAIAKDEPDYYLSMGLTAEAVANEYSINREDQDVFAFQSHQKAMKAIQDGNFKSGIIPITVEEVYVNEKGKKATRSYVVDTDEGVRADTTVEALAKLKPAFATGGSVTAGNSSQTSDEGIIANIDTYDYDCKCLTWTTDGTYVGTVFLREGKFSMTTHCGALFLRAEFKDKVSLEYMQATLNNILPLHKEGEGSNKRLGVTRIEKIQINIPIDKKNNYDIEAQKRIAERYSTIKEIKENIKSELEKIENVKVDIGL